MRAHKFTIGQRVYFAEGMDGRPARRDSYNVVRLLPSETADCQYRVKNAENGLERVVLESELSEMP